MGIEYSRASPANVKPLNCSNEQTPKLTSDLLSQATSNCEVNNREFSYTSTGKDHGEIDEHGLVPSDYNYEPTTVQNAASAATDSYSYNIDDDDSANLVNLLFPSDSLEDTGGSNQNEGMERQVIPCLTTRDEFTSSQNLYTDELNTEEKVKAEFCGKKLKVKFFSPREVRSGNVIGEGGFGRVLKGNLGSTSVAIKLLHAPINTEDIYEELNQLMTAKHKNIVSVYGIVAPMDELDCPQIVLQYFPEGNVLQYLSRKENPDDVHTLGKFGLDMIDGCKYLQEKGIIHGNLAARNILIEKVVGRQKTYHNAKVSDMGLIHFVEPSGGNYMRLPGSDRILPIRWVPKEIIEEQENGTVGTPFTFASDMWSFGVVLWEIFTRGAIPYGASYSNLRVLQFLKDDYSPLKVHRPSDCPAHIITAMEDIFRVNATERPTMDALLEVFKVYKGYGRDNPNITKSGKSVRSQGSHDEYSGAAGDESSGMSPGTFQYDQSSKGEDKAAKKKRKNKNKNKSNHPSDITHRVDGLVEQMSGAMSMPLHNSRGGRGGGGRGLEPRTPSAGESGSTSAESTIAGLLHRVNQLEKERLQFGRGGGPRNKHVGHIPNGPRFQRNDNYSGDGIVPPPITTSSQAPPPYTEVPLPHHSSSRYAGLSDYSYTDGPLPGPSRPVARGHQRGNRGGNSTRGGTASSSVAGSFGEVGFIHKIKRLAEEIEVLRAEKMTQELLKKSAELANLMKHMTDAGESSSASDVVSRAGPSRVPRTRQYDDYSSYNYHNPRQDADGRWEGHREERPYNFHPNQQQSQQQNRGHSSYYKSPNPGRGHRGFGKRGGGGSGDRDWSGNY